MNFINLKNSRGFFPLLILFTWSSWVGAVNFSSSISGVGGADPDYESAAGGSFTVTANGSYDGNCGPRARVKYVSGSCSPTDTNPGWNKDHGNNCWGTSTQVKVFTLSATPTSRCVVQAEAAANSGGNPSRNYVVGLAQSIVIDTPAPAGPRTYGTTFNVAAHSTSGGAVTVTAGGGCVVSGSNTTTGLGSPVTIQMTSGTTACGLTYSRADYNQFNPAANVTSSTSAQKAAQTITETQAPPAVENYNNSFTVKAVSDSGLAVAVTSANGCTGSGTGAGTLITMNAGGGLACSVTYSQAGDANYNAAVVVTRTVKVRQTITITQPAPASAAYNDVFVVKATVDSGLVVDVVASGGCSGSGTGAGTAITMNPSGGQACVVTYSQTAGNANYGPATVLASTTKVKQTITQTTPAPASADYNSSFGVAATASSALSVAVTVSGGCSITAGGTNSATILMTSGTTACTVTYTQAGDANYALVTASYIVNATKTAQVITFPAQTTASRIFANLSTFAISPLATGGGSGNAVTYSSLDTGKCTVAGTTVTMKGVGNCVIAADQAGNANYAAATQTTQIVQLTKALQTINVTVHAPASRGMARPLV